MRNLRFVDIAGACAGIAFLVLAAWAVVGESEPAAPVTVPELRAAFSKQIASLGPERAYASFKEMHEGKEPNILHNYAHIFGEELYSVSGLSGVRACDAAYTYGCFHGFFTRAVLDRGIGIVPELDTICRDAPLRGYLPCQHGIGHGIMEYVGHRNLPAALQACETIGDIDPIGGCYSGVFMEYNVPLSVSDQGLFTPAARPFDPSTPYDPCPGVDTKAKEACYYELPQWWSRSYPEDYARLGAMCSGIREEGYREACFTGIGSMLASVSQFDPAPIARACDQISSPAGSAACRASAAQVLAKWRADAAGAKALCSAVPAKYQELCPE